MNPFYNRMTRRAALQQAACGFGGLALAGLCADPVRAANPTRSQSSRISAQGRSGSSSSSWQGGPSHVDTFDYKPLLLYRNGRQEDALRRRAHDRQYGQSRQLPSASCSRCGSSSNMVSRDAGFRNYFVRQRKHSDDLTFIHSIHTEGVAHGPATLFHALWFDQFCAAVIWVLGYLWAGVREREHARVSFP